MMNRLTQREVAILMGAAVLVAFAFALAFRAQWLNERSELMPAVATAEKSSSADRGRDEQIRTEAFNRVLIRNIGTVSFEEVFDLLRAAPPDVRTAWLRQLIDMPHGLQRSTAIGSFYKTYVQLDPRGAAESINMMPDEDSVVLAVNSMIGAAPISAMPILAEMLTTVPRKRFGLMDPAYDVIGGWSLVDPAAAAQFVEAHPTFPVQTLLGNWAAIDPEAASSWFSRRPKDDDWSNNLRSLVDGWYDKDKTGAIVFALKASTDEDYEDASSTVAEHLFPESPAEARDFVSQLGERARRGAIDSIIQLSSRDESYGAKNRPDPKAIAEWLLTLPVAWQENTMRSALLHWTEKNRTEAVDWIDHLPPGTRDRTIADYVGGEHSDETLKLAMTISDPSLRESTLKDYMESWLHVSHDEAIEVLNGTHLSETQKKYLMRFLPKK